MCNRCFPLVVFCLIIGLSAQTTLCQPNLGQFLNGPYGVRFGSHPIYYPGVAVVTNKGQNGRDLKINIQGNFIQKLQIDLDLKTSKTVDNSWAKTFLTSLVAGNWSMSKTSDAGYIVGGGYWNDEKKDGDAYIIKLDDNGNILFQSGFGGNLFDWVSAIQQTKDGGFAAAGSTSSFHDSLGGDFLVLKIDSDGRLLWAKTYGGTESSGGISRDQAYSLEETLDEGFILTGETWSSGVGYGDFLVIKLDAQGNVMWQRTYGQQNWDWAYSSKQAIDGGFVITGWSKSFGSGKGDVLMLRLDINGNLLWEKIYMATERTVPGAVEVTSDGGYLVAGYTDFPGTGDSDILAVKLDANGNIEWQKLYRGNSGEGAYGVRQTEDGSYILVGATYSFGAGSGDMLIMKTDKDGNQLWAKAVGTFFTDWANAVVETQVRGYAVAGSFGGNLAIVKFDSSGNVSACPPWLEIHDATLTQSVANTQTASPNVVVGTPNFGASVSLSVAPSSRTADSPCSTVYPSATTLMADSVSTASAIIRGNVNPNGVFARAWFFWDTNSNLSELKSTPIQSVGFSSNTVSISAKLTGLTANTTYYYTVFAQNSSRSSSGQILHFTTSSATAVEEINKSVPIEYVLHQNFPNPFNPVTSIEFSLPKSSYVTLTIFSTLGTQIQTLINQKLSPGTYRAQWDTIDVPSGVYFYHLVAGSFAETKKMLLLR